MPDSYHTPRELSRKVHRESGQSRAPIGEKQIRAAIARGDLPAARIGNADLIRWGDFVDWIAQLAAARKPAPIERTRAERMEPRVQARLRREREAR